MQQKYRRIDLACMPACSIKTRALNPSARLWAEVEKIWFFGTVDRNCRSATRLEPATQTDTLLLLLHVSPEPHRTISCLLQIARNCLSQSA